jgi:peroxiredoxin
MENGWLTYNHLSSGLLRGFKQDPNGNILSRLNRVGGRKRIIRIVPAIKFPVCST